MIELMAPCQLPGNRCCILPHMHAVCGRAGISHLDREREGYTCPASQS